MKNLTSLISIVIANYNGEKYLNTCLKSVLISNYHNFELLIVDDGSTDSSIEMIDQFMKKDKRIKLIRNDRNLGAAASRNRALKIYKGEIVVFLDNDTEVAENWLNNLMEPMLQDSKIGAAQALLLDFKNRDSIQMAGGKLIKQAAWVIPYYQWNKYSEIKNDLSSINIIAISAALAVKREVINKVIGFDEKESVYTEDIDLSWRIWIAGYKVVLSPNAIVYHWTKSVLAREHMGATFKNIYYHLTKNSIRSMIKNYELANVIRYLLFSVGISLGRGMLFIFLKRNSNALSGAVKGILWNIYNFFDTISARQQVQSVRVVSDKDLIKNIFIDKLLFTLYKDYFYGK